jgi:hypothetical protein
MHGIGVELALTRHSLFHTTCIAQMETLRIYWIITFHFFSFHLHFLELKIFAFLVDSFHWVRGLYADAAMSL